MLNKNFVAAIKGTGTRSNPEANRLVLVVDDELEITRSIADLLRKQFDVRMANSGDEALAILAREDIGVILSDQRMPGMTGAEFLSRAAQARPEAMRIMLTGYADIESVIRAVNDGHIFFYLTKPWNAFDLLSIATKAMEHYELTRENRRLIEALRLSNVQLTQTNLALEQRVAERTSELQCRNDQLEAANRTIGQLAITDILTGLANRRRLEEVLPLEVDRCLRQGVPLALVMMDLDHFKAINDDYGHSVGDDVLHTVGAFLARILRSYDFAARYGGEEFVLLLPGSTLEQGLEIAERLRTGLRSLGNQRPGYPISASFGVSSLQGESSSGALLERADAALYRAKRSGRDRVEPETPLSIPSTESATQNHPTAKES